MEGLTLKEVRAIKRLKILGFGYSDNYETTDKLQWKSADNAVSHQLEIDEIDREIDEIDREKP